MGRFHGGDEFGRWGASAREREKGKKNEEGESAGRGDEMKNMDTGRGAWRSCAKRAQGVRQLARCVAARGRREEEEGS